jgi:hypothetical protein
MKKTLVAASAMAVLFLAVSIANAQFGSVRVPGVGSVSTDVQKYEYDECKSFCDKYRNNIDYNSTNIEGVFNNNSDTSIQKYSKDWRRGGSKYDKEHKVLEFTSNYKTMHKITTRCNDEKCNTIYCSKK